MKKILLIVLLLVATYAWAAPPSRVATYTSGALILSNDVTSNEDAIFTYLQNGVDTVKDNSILNADVNASANIQADKLNLTSIQQNIVNVGTFTNTGNATVTGTLAVSSSISATGLVATTSIKADAYYSGDNSLGVTKTCTSGFTLTVKDGLITACN